MDIQTWFLVQLLDTFLFALRIGVAGLALVPAVRLMYRRKPRR